MRKLLESLGITVLIVLVVCSAITVIFLLTTKFQTLGWWLLIVGIFCLLWYWIHRMINP